MNDITLPRATVEQALEAMRRAVPTGKITLYEWDRAISDLSAALAMQRLTDAQQEMERSIESLKAALAQQAEPVEPVLQTCNCRWDGEVQVQQCTLHEAHVDAIHEWAERAKVAERKLAQQAEPVEPVAWMHNILEDNIIRHRPADLKRSPQNWTPLCNCAQPRQSDPQIEDRLARHGIPKP